MRAARAATNVMNFIVVGERVREDSLSVLQRQGSGERRRIKRKLEATEVDILGV